MNKRIWAIVLALTVLLSSAGALADVLDSGAVNKTATLTYTVTDSTYEENLFTYELYFPTRVDLTRANDNATVAKGTMTYGIQNIQPGASGVAEALTCPWIAFELSLPDSLQAYYDGGASKSINLIASHNNRTIKTIQHSYGAAAFENAIKSPINGECKITETVILEANVATLDLYGVAFEGIATYNGSIMQ